MAVKLTKDAELERQEDVRQQRENRPAWELVKTTSLVEAVHRARDLGWKEKKVQVKMYKMPEGLEYHVEPFERDCGCRSLLKYSDFFD